MEWHSIRWPRGNLRWEEKINRKTFALQMHRKVSFSLLFSTTKRKTIIPFTLDIVPFISNGIIFDCEIFWVLKHSANAFDGRLFLLKFRNLWKIYLAYKNTSIVVNMVNTQFGSITTVNYWIPIEQGRVKKKSITQIYTKCKMSLNGPAFYGQNGAQYQGGLAQHFVWARNFKMFPRKVTIRLSMSNKMVQFVGGKKSHMIFEFLGFHSPGSFIAADSSHLDTIDWFFVRNSVFWMKFHLKTITNSETLLNSFEYQFRSNGVFLEFSYEPNEFALFFKGLLCLFLVHIFPRIPSEWMHFYAIMRLSDRILQCVFSMWCFATPKYIMLPCVRVSSHL